MGFHSRDATFVVEQLWPGVDIDLASAQLDRVTSVAASLPANPRPRVWGATLIPDDETLFTWCAAPSIDSVRELFAASGVRFDRVLTVVHTPTRKAEAR
jgi:hypothetical protein